MNPLQIERWLDRNAYKLTNSVQYLGDGPNTLQRSWDGSSLRWLMVASWPYEHAAGNQSIPYVAKAVTDASPAYLCDRFYLPATPRDMRLLERGGVPVFGIESKHQLSDFDVVGTSISYLVLLMNFMKMLSMSGVPLRWRDREARAGEYPMIIIGGQAYSAPGAMEPVADCIWLGEADTEPGNGGMAVVCARIEQYKRAGLWKTDRIGCYRKLALEFSYLHFPRFVRTSYRYEDRGLPHASKQVSGYASLLPGMSFPRSARKVRNMDKIAPLDKAPLLYADPALGAGDLESARGCPAWCSFPLIGSTEFVTRQGLRTVSSAVGESVEVWTGSGGWCKGTVEAHGPHAVQRIVFAPATASGWALTATCEYGHPRSGEIPSLRKTGRSLSQPATVGPRGQCRACMRLKRRNAYYRDTGQPEKVVHLEPVLGWQRYQNTGWRVSSRTTVRQDVVATPCHGWELADGAETHDLQVGDVVRASAPDLVDESSREHKRGWIHGMIFGDGSKAGVNHTRGYSIRLHGEKDQAHLWRFREAMSWDYVLDGMQVRSVTYPHHPVSPDGEPKVWIRALTPLKEYPRPEASSAYLSGFLAGWLAADSAEGSNGEKDVRRLYSQRADARRWLDRFAAAAGWLVVGHSVHNQPTNFGKRSAPMNSFVLARPSSGRAWKVVSIEPEPGTPEVFCLTVPGSRRFTLAAGILTGNCRLSWLTKPYRQRSVQRSVEHAAVWYRNMGAVEISPFAPDFPMHTERKTLIARLLTEVSDELDSVAMRVDDAIADGDYWLLSSLGGMDAVTLGLEGNSQRMRDLVGKGISDREVEEAVTRAIRAGIRKIKLFMITNLPGEEPGDVMRIVRLAERLAAIRDSLGQPNVQIQFSWTPLLIEAGTPFQWFAPTPPDHTLIQVADLFKGLKIAFKIGTKAEPNKLALFQLCQRASADVGEAIVDVLADLDIACWGGVPRDMQERLDTALRARGFANGFADCFDERTGADLFGWEYIGTGVSRDLLYRTYRQMVEFLENTDAGTYDDQLGDAYRGQEFVARCDTQCMGNTCGVCSGEDLKLRSAYIEAGQREQVPDLSAVHPVDQSTVAQKVLGRVSVPARLRFVDPDHWRFSLRRAAYQVADIMSTRLPDGFSVAKRSIRLVSDGLDDRGTHGISYIEFGLTRELDELTLQSFLEGMAVIMRPWMDLQGGRAVAPRFSLKAEAGASLYSLTLHDDPDIVIARLRAWDRQDYIKATFHKDSSYFNVDEEINAKDCVDDMWLKRDGSAVTLRMLSRGPLGPYQLCSTLMGQRSWIEAMAYSAPREDVFLAHTTGVAAAQGDLLRPPCTGCGGPRPQNLAGDDYDPDRCPRCMDNIMRRVLAGLVQPAAV